MTKEDFFEQAVNAFGDDKLDESIELYKKALELDPRYQDALHGLGMAYFNHGKFEEAAQTAKRLIEIDSDDVLAHTSLSMIYHAQGRIEDAEKEGNLAKIMGWKEELKKGKPS
jgi:tetratricopeptide (TPR) repeat protein